MKKQIKKTTHLTPTQVRNKIVSVLKAHGYAADTIAFDMGRQKAWLRPIKGGQADPKYSTCSGRMLLAKNINKAITYAGVQRDTYAYSTGTQVRLGYGGELEVEGPGWRLVLNHDPECQDGRVGGAFVEAWSTSARRAA